MNKKIAQNPESADIISTYTEYYRISRAADLIGCTVDDLLHMGATGNLQIIAPVVAEGLFEWPVGDAIIGFHEIDYPFREKFDATDRIILSFLDLAHIEAVGWVIPSFFLAPLRARAAIERNPISLTEALDRINESKRKALSNSETKRKNFEKSLSERHKTGDESDQLLEAGARKGFEFYINSLSEPIKPDDPDLTQIREFSFYSPWHLVEMLGSDAEKTTVDHLFITKKEVIRLKNGAPQDAVALKLKELALELKPAKIHGNSKNHAMKREEILRAAIYCKEQWPDRCENKNEIKNTRWAALIDEKAPLFWKTGEAPRSRSYIERLLSKARRLPKDVKKK